MHVSCQVSVQGVANCAHSLFRVAAWAYLFKIITHHIQKSFSSGKGVWVGREISRDLPADAHLRDSITTGLLYE